MMTKARRRNVNEGNSGRVMVQVEKRLQDVNPGLKKKSTK